MIKPYFIGIAGGSGSGKTTLAEKLIKQIGPDAAILVSHDHYYCDQSHLSAQERALTNYDHPRAYETALLISHLKVLKSGNPVDMPVYDFVTDTRSQKTRRLSPKPIVIVEGILIFQNPELRKLFNLKVFLDEASDVRLIRRINRDMQVAGRSYNYIVSKYLHEVRPMYLQYVEPTKKHADLIIPEETSLDQALLDILTAMPTN